MPGVRVQATGETASQVAVTAADGSYSFDHLPPGKYQLAVLAQEQFATSAKAITLEPGVCSRISFYPAKYAVLEGRLWESDGEPDDSSRVSLVPIGLASPQPVPGEESELETESDEGKFRFRVPPGRYRLAVKELGSVDQINYPDEIMLHAAHMTRVHFRLPKQPVQIIQGIVVDADGKPIAGAKVGLNGRAPDGSGVFGSVQTGADGRFLSR